MKSNINKLHIILKQCKFVLWPFGTLLILVPMLHNLGYLSTIIGGFSVVLGFVWGLFEKKLWKVKWINNILKKSENFCTPIIEGRWEGTLKRNGEDHAFVIEIKQSFTSISCETHSHHSYSASEYAELLHDEQNDRYKLVFLWEGKTTNCEVEGMESTNYFYGTTILYINDLGNKLTGFYFTDRQPKQTRGEIFLDFRQKMLKKSF